LSVTMSDLIACFVMSGGVGSRLWPLSREDNPKQFHDLSGDGSMLAKTLRRMTGRTAGAAPVFLIASERHAGRVHGDINGIDLAGGGVLFEPVGRNTAAAVALATLRTLADFGDSFVLVVPSDHEISTTAQFWQTVQLARAGWWFSAFAQISPKPAMAISRSARSKAACSMYRASWKSPTPRRRRNISPRAITTGMQASFCSAQA
jgi:hypothetical protein